MKFFSSFLSRGLLALLLLVNGCPVAAQAPVWQSARAVAVSTAAATGNFSAVTATAVDAAGNVYLAGAFANTVVLGSTTLTSLGSNDVFVAKFNPASNQFVWAQRAGGTGDDGANKLAVSGTDVYMAGYFKSTTAGFGAITLTNAGPAHTSDVFVAKFTTVGSTGSFVWAQRAGGTGNDDAGSLVVNGLSVYVAGGFMSPTAGFGSVTLTNADSNVGTYVGTYDMFVAKLTDAGSFVWAQRAGGTYSDYAGALAVSGTSVYVAGNFRSPTVVFGATTLTSAGVADMFVAKLTDAGSFVWAQRAGSTGDDFAAALAVSGTSVYVAGNFRSPTVVFSATTLTSAGAGDVFVAKLTDAGSFVWAQRAGGTGDDGANSLAVSGTSVYVAGNFVSATAGFDTTTLTNTYSNLGTYDVFVAKCTDRGSSSSFDWAQRAGDADYDITAAMAVSGTSVYIAGNFVSPTIDFGATTLTNPNFGSLGFLASLTDATTTATTAAPPYEPLTISPNPAHHTATLRLPTGTTPAPLTLTDAQGRTVRRYPAPAGPAATLDLRGLPAGFYLLSGAGRPQRLVVE